jgi:hypothetical protein
MITVPLILSFFEVCSPGPRVAECVVWMSQCHVQQLSGGLDEDGAWENCMEMLPYDLWPKGE